MVKIRQYQHLEDGSVNVVTRGQQRFHLRRRWMDVEGSPCGEIQIVKEDLPLRTPRLSNCSPFAFCVNISVIRKEFTAIIVSYVLQSNMFYYSLETFVIL